MSCSFDPYVAGAQPIAQRVHDGRLVSPAIDLATFGDEALPLPVGDWERNALGQAAGLAGIGIADDLDGLDQLRSAPRCLARSEDHTSELQSIMRISYAVFCLKQKEREKVRTPLKKAH